MDVVILVLFFISILEAIRRELLDEPVKPKSRSKNKTGQVSLI